jgi:hypothetical protein
VKTRKQNKSLRDMGVAFAIVLSIPVVAFVSVMTVFVVWAPADENTLSSKCGNATPAGDFNAAEAGRVIVAGGEVSGVRNLEEGVFLDLAEQGSDRGLAVVIPRGSIENWTLPPDQQYDGQEIATAGILELSGGDLRIEARSPDDIAICP